jgi:hypothetical protein
VCLIFASFLDELLESVSDIFVKITTYLNFVILENELIPDSEVSPGKEGLLVLLVTKVHEKQKSLKISGIIEKNEENGNLDYKT